MQTFNGAAMCTTCIYHINRRVTEGAAMNTALHRKVCETLDPEGDVQILKGGFASTKERPD